MRLHFIQDSSQKVQTRNLLGFTPASSPIDKTTVLFEAYGMHKSNLPPFVVHNVKKIVVTSSPVSHVQVGANQMKATIHSFQLPSVKKHKQIACDDNNI